MTLKVCATSFFCTPARAPPEVRWILPTAAPTNDTDGTVATVVDLIMLQMVRPAPSHRIGLRYGLVCAHASTIHAVRRRAPELMCTVCDEVEMEQPGRVCLECRRRCGRCGLHGCHCEMDVNFLERRIRHLMADPWTSANLPWLAAMRTGCWFVSGLNGCRIQSVYSWWMNVGDRIRRGSTSKGTHAARRHIAAIGGHLFANLAPHPLLVQWLSKVLGEHNPRCALAEEVIEVVFGFMFSPRPL